MEKAFVAQRVAKKLFVTEAAVDGALAEASELMSEMLKRLAEALGPVRASDIMTNEDVARVAMAAMRDADLRPFVDALNKEMREKGNEFSLTGLWHAVFDEALKES
jgi:hypothetical protein